MDSIIDRLISIKDSKCKSVRNFALSIGCNQKTIDLQLKGERSVSLETVVCTLRTFEDISPDWLLLGVGPMIRTTENTNKSREGLIRMYQDLLEVRDERIRDLEKRLIEFETRKMSV